jgi:hypothetical protein
VSFKAVFVFLPTSRSNLLLLLVLNFRRNLEVRKGSDRSPRFKMVNVLSPLDTVRLWDRSCISLI